MNGHSQGTDTLGVHPYVVAILERMEKHDYSAPRGFPCRNLVVCGMQPLFSMVAYDGRYYPPGCTPPALYERWEALEELAHGLAKQLLDHGVNKYPDKSKEEILARYLEQVRHAVDDSEELAWAGCRAAELAGCQTPLARQS